MLRKIFAIVGVVALAFGLSGCDVPTTEKSVPTTEKIASTPEAAAPTGPATAATTIPTTSDAPTTGGVPYAHEVGFAWLVPTTIDPGVRKLDVYENGTKLGGADALHEDIRKIGKGLYSHWKSGEDSKIYFSTSDNSDPNTNGRTYEFK